MRRSFRVATVFTGVAAVAGGFGPTALAAAASRSGSITNVVCGANNGGLSTWVHMYYPNDDHPAECVGGEGWTTANATIASLCPGNNFGDLFGSIGTRKSSLAFYASEGRHTVEALTGVNNAYFRISRIAISSWSGEAQCLG